FKGLPDKKLESYQSWLAVWPLRINIAMFAIVSIVFGVLHDYLDSIFTLAVALLGVQFITTVVLQHFAAIAVTEVHRRQHEAMKMDLAQSWVNLRGVSKEE
ncbi:hypothetical protein, partial [Vibrio sp. 10N.222.49.C9]